MLRLIITFFCVSFVFAHPENLKRSNEAGHLSDNDNDAVVETEEYYPGE